MDEQIKNVLILCTGNSARSVLGECLFNRFGEGRYRAFSAGSSPVGQINPHALKLLESKGYATSDLRSKSWDEFSGAEAPQLDFIFTVCDDAAGETCPIWPGRPITAHWGLPDPAAVEGTDAEKDAAFEEAYGILRSRIERFLALDHERTTPPDLIDELIAIGKT